MASIRQRLSKVTLIEWLIIGAIITVLVALLTAEPQWASSGSIRLPVRVFVFDANRLMPIAGGQVLVFRAPPTSDANSLADSRDRFPTDPLHDLPIEYLGVTDAVGMAIVEHEFRTGASHKHPISHAHVSYVWVKVEADGYGGAVIPVRHESQPTSALRKQGEIGVQVGLIPTIQNEK